MLYAEVQPVFANLFAKLMIIREFSLNLHPNLTKVDSRHDSTNHASMFLDEPSGKAERVLAAPRIMTVGGHIESSHLKPSKIGDVVKATAEVTKVDGKKIEFKVSAHSGETLLGEGTHLRFIVDREKFMSRL